MQAAFFQYKIYRQKFIASMLVVVLVSTALFCGLSVFFVNGWMEQQRRAAADAFESADAGVRSTIRRTDEYVQLLYSDARMMQDISALFSSATEWEYLMQRKKDSRSNTAQIRYFPGDLKKIITGSSGMITGITLLSNTGVKALSLNLSSGEMELQFGLTGGEAANLRPQGSDVLLATYPIHDPNSLSRWIGEIRFWGSGRTVSGTPRLDAGICAILDETGQPENSFIDDTVRRWLQEAAAAPQNEGSFVNGLFSRVYYAKFASSIPGYRYVALTDTASLLAQNGGTLVGLLAAFAVLDMIIIMWILHGIRYDASFLGYILEMIGDVERGDFTAAEDLGRPGSVRENEYGIIAEAVRNMSCVLDEYIRIEYRMKLKQQETAMRVLQHQINPHFLYNTLETIRSQALVRGDLDTADSIALLGSLYRDVVRGGSIITLRDEFDLLDAYLRIMQLRYPESLSYQIELEPEMDGLDTVKFWLQPLAENFFTHGFDRSSEYNLLIVTGYQVQGGWCVELIDNGSGVAPHKLKGLNAAMQTDGDDKGARIGLRNVYGRLAFFYGKGFTMEIRNNAEGGACISIHIPKKEDG